MDDRATIANLERRLAESEARHGLLLEGWAQAMWETDARGVVVVDSPSWRAYTGQAHEEWLGYGWLDAVHPNDRAYAERQWRAAVAARGLVNAEFRLRAPDGGWRWTNVRAAPVLDAGGKVEKWAGMNIDIDARKQAEAALRESEERLRIVFGGIDEAFYALDQDWRFLFASQSALRIWGKASDEVLGKLFLEAFPHAAGSPPYEAHQRVMRTGAPERLEAISPVLGHWIEADISRTAVGGLSVAFRDVTERKQAEQALREGEERQAFLLKLSDALRSLAHPVEIQESAMRLLAQHLDTVRATLFELDPDGDGLRPTARYERDAAPVPARMRLSDFGPEITAAYRAGQSVTFRDTESETHLGSQPQMYRDLGLRAWIGTPLVKDGRLVAVVGVNSAAARDWTDAQVRMVEDVAERTWAAVERARAEEARRLAEERLLAASEAARVEVTATLESIGDAFYAVDADFRLTYVNAKAEAMWGRPRETLVGRNLWSEFPLAVGGEPHARHLAAMRDRRPAHFQGLSPVLSRWMEASLYPDPASGGLACYFRDVTERRAAEAALRESEEKFRRLFNTIDEGLAVVEMIYDVHGEIVDMIYRQTNGAYERQGGVYDVAGRSIFDVIPGVEEHWLRPYKEVARTGRSERVENYQQDVDRWFDVYFSRVDDSGRFIAIVFKDISERKRAERISRESEERQAFLLKLSDTLRPLRDALEIQQAAIELLGPYLAVNRAGYYEVGIDQDTFFLTARWERGAPPLPERMLITDFGDEIREGYRAGRTMVARDTEQDAASEPNLAAVRALQIRAWIGVPLVKEGRWFAAVGVHSLSPRDWTPAEIRLVEEVGERTWAATERARAEAALRDSEAQQRLTLQLVPAMLWWADASGQTITANERWRFYTGQDEAEVQNFGWFNAIHPDDVEETRAAFEHAFSTGEPLERQQRIRQAGNGHRWHLVRHVPVRDAGGAITRWFGAAIDVHELREMEERQHVLVAELQHRTRNLMGVVRSVADKTMSRSADLADFRVRFGDRLDALARVQGLLSRLDDWDRVTFDELIRSEISAINGEAERVSLSGPSDVALRSSTVQTLALAIHELATNALKYGALAQPEGQLAIAWRLDRAERDGRPWLHVDWRESGVVMPAPGAPVRGGGSGRELIERALPYQLGAKTTFVMETDGVHCTIAMPASEKLPA